MVLYRSPECWGYAELEQTWSTQCFLSCHPYRSIRKQIWACHKNGHGQPRVILWKKPQGMSIQPLGTKSGSILKLMLFPSFWTSSRKIPFASYIILYDILFYFIHVYIAPGQGETTLGDNFLMEAERSYHFNHWLHVSRNSLALGLYALFFLILYMYIAPGQRPATHYWPLGPKF